MNNQYSDLVARFELKYCDKCQKCVEICPTGALNLNPLSIDMGKCTFCRLRIPVSSPM